MAWRTYLSRHVRELRFLIHRDMTIEKSAAIRSYIQKNYDELKMLNPATPFLVRDGWPDGPPQIIFTYDWGKEVIKDIGGLNEEQIDNVLKDGVKFGETLPKYWDPVEWKPLEIVDGLPKPEWY